MAKLAPPKKASKPTAPKRPTSRSKTGNAACSEAASNWQLSLRGKASLDPETYRTLAKCRSMNRTAKMAEAQGRTGKLSAMGESAVKGRLQARFDSGLITQKARKERLDMLLKQRSQRGNAGAPKPASSFTTISPEEQAVRDRFRQIAKKNPQSPAVTGESKLDAWKRKNAAYERENAAVEVATVTNSRPGEAIPPRAKTPSYTLNVGNSIDRSGKLIPGYAAHITGTDPKYKLKREFLPLKNAKDGGLTVTQRGLYESRGPSTSIFGTDRANKPTEREYILIGRKKVRNLVDFQAERAVRLMERFRKS